MKQTLIGLLILFVIFPSYAYSQTPTVTKTKTTTTQAPTITDGSTTEKLSEQINNLKDRIASRVAELNLVEKRGIIGSVTQTSSSQITLTDIEEKTRIVEVDEITKFSSPGKKEGFGLSDITRGMKISIVGLYNKQSKRITARYINVVTIPTYINGMVASTDEDAFTISVTSEDGKQTIVDIENVTKTNVYTAEDEISKSGFSDITIGERVIITGYPDKNDPKRIVATRVLLFPELPRNPKIIIPDKALLDDDTPVTSSGSGKKLTPVR